MKNWPLDEEEGLAVSVIIPCRNEEKYIEKCIHSIYSSMVFAGKVGQIIVVDGESEDGTPAILEGLSNIYPNLTVMTNELRTTPTSLNMALKLAIGDVIIRVDGHATVAEDFIAKNLQTLSQHPEAGCVGGAIENTYSDTHSKAIGLAMSSRFGVGNARFRTGGTGGYVDTLAFGAYRKEVFDEVGIFDPVLVRNQDDEFNFRLIRSGRKIFFNPEIRSLYFNRSSFQKLWKQYFQYGYWKVYVNRKHGAVTTLRQLFPLALISVFVVLALTILLQLFWSNFFIASVFMLSMFICSTYIGLLIFYSLIGNGSTGSAFPFLKAKAFVFLHFSYGMGYLNGIWDFIILGKQGTVKHQNLSR